MSSNTHIHSMHRALRLWAVVTGLCLCSAAMAQTQQSSSTAVRRADTKAANETSGTTVTDRMQSHYGSQGLSDDDADWRKVVYRSLDLEKVENAPLYYPEELVEGQENLFRIILRLVADGQISVYEYLDGREEFTDEYKVNVGDMLDRFHVIYTQPRSSKTTYVIEPGDVPAGEVMSYYILERWEVDKRNGRMRTTVDAICPVLHRTGDFGGEAIKYPMFWVSMADLRPHLTGQAIFVDDDNNLPQYTYNDYFTLGLYDGEIYKTRNVRNKTLMQLYPDPDDLKHAQDSIDHYLTTYEDKMWVPSREEIAAMNNDSTAVAQSKVTRTRTKEVKTTKVKEAKVKNTAGATRSVRRRK